MRHRMSGKQLSRTTSHRKAMRRNMAGSLFEHGAIRTTEAKAKELRRFAERLITIAKAGTLHARRRVIALLGERKLPREDDGQAQTVTVVQKLFDDVAPRYVDRPGGYTRIIRLAERRVGDAGRQVLLQLVEETAATSSDAASGQGRRRRRAAKRHEAAAGAADDQQQAEPDAQDEQEDQAAPEQEAEDTGDGDQDADQQDKDEDKK